MTIGAYETYLTHEEHFAGLRFKEIIMRIGDFLNVTTKQLGAIIGVSGNMVAEYQRGERYPHPDRIEDICMRLAYHDVHLIPELLQRQIDDEKDNYGEYDKQDEIKIQELEQEEGQMTFGEWMQLSRYSLGIPRADIAKAIGVDYSKLLYWDTGWSFPLPENFGKLVDFFRENDLTVNSIVVKDIMRKSVRKTEADSWQPETYNGFHGRSLSFAETITSCRTELGIPSCAEMSRQVGLSLAKINRIENGQIPEDVNATKLFKYLMDSNLELDFLQLIRTFNSELEKPAALEFNLQDIQKEA